MRDRAMIGRLQQQLPAMFALAHQRSEGARVELAGMLADALLIDDAQLSLREEELVNELIEQLLQSRTPAVRAQLVNKFAEASRMPRKMAVSLASDSIDIARKVLQTSRTLTDEDLITVVASQSRDHARAVAQRQEINEAVADALVTTGDVRVMQLVAENLGAKLSVRAVDVLADSARFTAELRRPVMERPEMTKEAASRLYWWVSQDLRRYALKRFNISAGQVDECLAKTVDQLLGYHDLEKNNDETMQQVAEWMHERQALSVRILPQVLRLGHFRLFNILLSRLTHLSLTLIDTIVSETGGRGLAVICRSLGIDKPGFVSIFLLSRGSRPGEQIVHP
ncbi:MAG TPA: DUF2336 domain-containing protein, partial [Alphaproteobacteria bacterium]|nr:DUF2336 domain-containing protein [Alphaproteobacteria bacterium]